jgi:hypothetical protein
MSKIPMTDVDDVLFNPTRYFSTPLEVVTVDGLDHDQKIALLLNWEWDVKLEEVAEEENMHSDRPDILQDIKKALKLLGIASEMSPPQTTKFGGV